MITSKIEKGANIVSIFGILLTKRRTIYLHSIFLIALIASRGEFWATSIVSVPRPRCFGL